MTDPTRDETTADAASDDASDAVITADPSDAASDDAPAADSVDLEFGYASAEEALTDVVGNLERVTAERDEYLDMARRVQAEFENYKRRVESQRIEQIERAAEAIVVEILPVLDACEAALSHGAEDVAPIQAALVNTLTQRGLARVDEVEVAFDPVVHEAVMHEPHEADDAGDPVVSEILRTGYSWKGRVVRPAMVKVRG